MYASSVQGEAFECKTFVRAIKVIPIKPSAAFLCARKLRSEQRAALFQSSKRNAAPHKGSAFMRRPFKKVDENFNLLAALVSAHRRAQPLLRNHSAALPEKDSLYQSFRQAFFKRPRILYPVRNQNYEKNKSWIYIARMSEESDRHRGHAQRACRCRL